jgi:hypothetical protein
MKRICCECGKIMGEKPGEGDTHGYCSKCEDNIRESLGLATRKMEKKNWPTSALLEVAVDRIEEAINIIDQLAIKLPRSTIAGRSLVRSKAEARKAQSFIQMDWLDLRIHNQGKAGKPA